MKRIEMPMELVAIHPDSIEVRDATGRSFVMRVGHTIILTGQHPADAAIKEIIAEGIREEFSKLRRQGGVA